MYNVHGGMARRLRRAIELRHEGGAYLIQLPHALGHAAVRAEALRRDARAATRDTRSGPPVMIDVYVGRMPVEAWDKKNMHENI